MAWIVLALLGVSAIAGIDGFRAFIDDLNDSHPFTWTKTANQIPEHATPTKR